MDFCEIPQLPAGAGVATLILLMTEAAPSRQEQDMGWTRASLSRRGFSSVLGAAAAYARSGRGNDIESENETSVPESS
jgi:hypothetical protein